MDKTYDIIYSDTDNLNIYSKSNENIESNKYEEVVDILHPEETRWFYRSIASSQKNIFRPFCGYDSLRLETKFRELSSFKGNSNNDSSTEKIIVKSDLFETDVIQRSCVPIYWTDTEDNLDIYRGTWFVSDTYEPLIEPLSDAIETQYIMNFQSLSYTYFEEHAKNKNSKVLHTMTYDFYLVEWYELDEAYLYDTNSVLYRMKAFKMTEMSKLGMKIVRGYKENATPEDKPPDINHICFVVHGIGQRLSGYINRQCNKLKQCYKEVLKKYYLPKSYNEFRIEFLPIEWRSNLNLDGGMIDSLTPHEFKGLRTIFNNTIMDILYYSSSFYRVEIANGLQSELNRIYSMFCSRNPYFELKGGKVSIIAHSLGSVICYDIISSWANLSMNLNNFQSLDSPFVHSEESSLQLQYLNYLRNESFELDQDFMNVFNSQCTKFPLMGFKKPNFPSNFKKGTLWRDVKKIENFFMLGSPLSVFLALRGIKPRHTIDQDDIIPKHICKKIFNIYHNSDPVAYRLEPLLIKDYKNIEPIHIKTLIPEDELMDYETTEKRKTSNITRESDSGIFNEKIETNFSFHRMESKISKTIKKLKRKKSMLPAVDELQLKFNTLKEYSFFKRLKVFLNILKGKDLNEKEAVPDDYQSQVGYSDDVFLKQRLDYTLGEESGLSSYISLLTSHTSYWENINLCKFLIDQMTNEY